MPTEEYRLAADYAIAPMATALKAEIAPNAADWQACRVTHRMGASPILITRWGTRRIGLAKCGATEPIEGSWRRPGLKEALEQRRCLVITTGFFLRPRPNGPPAEAMHVRYINGDVMRLAAFYEIHRSDGKKHPSFHLLTVPSKGEITKYYPRQPIIVDWRNEEKWFGARSPDRALDAARDRHWAPIKVEQVGFFYW